MNNNHYLPPKDQILQTLKELLNIPICQRILFHKGEELRGIHENELKAYTEIVELAEPATPRTVEEFDFELTRQGKEWLPSVSGIPGTIVDYLIENTTPGIIVMSKEFEIDGEIFRLSNISRETKTITATIQIERTGQKAAAFIATETGGTTDISELKELLSYAYSHEEYFKFLISEFKLKWKPLIDQLKHHQRSTI